MIFRSVMIALILLLSLSTSFDEPISESQSTDEPVLVQIANLILNEQDRSVILILKPETEREDGSRVLPIVIGFEEARSIGVAFHKIDVPRPLTHDLMKNIIEQYGGSVISCTITKMERETFFAELRLKRSGREFVIDCRPSDAIGLALRSTAPVYVRRSVFQQHGVDPERQAQPEKALKT